MALLDQELDDPLARVVGAFTRAIRAMGYYDANHPVFETTRREAFQRLSDAFADRDIVTLGCGGRHLVIDPEGDNLTDEPSAAFATRMFKASVIALRFDPSVRKTDLGVLMKVMAEQPDRVRAAGGVREILARELTEGIEVMEVDFQSLFSGNNADLSPMVGGDPVAERALREVLRYREASSVGSHALEVNLAQLNDVESLGGFLDDLLDQAAPSVASGSRGHLNSDDLADQAARAYLQNQSQMKKSGQPQSELAKSAEVLSNALVRLAPDARFALLRRLAGADELAEPGHEDAIKALGGKLDDKLIVGTIASALVDQQGDPDAVRAIGNLIRRVRPVEANRSELLAQVDETMRKSGKPIDGVLWQEMQSKAFENGALGLMEVSLNETRPGLKSSVETRMRGQVRATLGQDILHTVASGVVENWSMQTMVALLGDPGRVQESALERIKEMIERLDDGGATDEALTLLRALMARVDWDRNPRLKQMAKEALEGERGSKWAGRILKDQTQVGGRMTGEVLLSALDRVGNVRSREALVQNLSQLSPRDLTSLANDYVSDAEPLRVQHLVQAALRSDARAGVKIARLALKNRSPKAKMAAIRALVEAPVKDSVALLAHIAGWKGDKYTHGLLALSDADQKKMTHRYQMAAVGALGMTKVALSVRPLQDILLRSSLLPDKELDELRLGAAQALMTNNTPQAQEVLKTCSKHKKKAVREVALRVLEGKRT